MLTKQKSDQINPQADWFQQAKFGLFLHWGAYSVAGVEASWPIMAPGLSETMFKNQTAISEEQYLTLPDQFNPVDFNAEEWVRTAKDAGMGYIIITAKHHDGFCMFDAPGTDYKITNTPYGKDICLELSQACAKAGMRLGFYYSPPDMHHPGYRNKKKPATKNWLGEPKRKEWGEYLDYMESHIHKLLTDYGEVSVLWFDGLFNHGKYDPERFHKLVHELSPNTLINDRLGDGYDYITPEQSIPSRGIPARTGKPPGGIDPGGDAFVKTMQFLMKVPLIGSWLDKQLNKYADGTLELTPVLQEEYPSPERFQPWETCMTMGQSWAHNPDETEWKTPRQLVHNLVEVVSRGGNFLLNVGPTAAGTFPKEAIDRLEYIGKWLTQNGKAIYGNTYTPLESGDWGHTTRKDDKLFLHVIHWPRGDKLKISNFPGTAKSVRFLQGKSLDFSQSGAELVIPLPNHSPDPDDAVIEITLAELSDEWENYSTPTITKTVPGQYIKTQVIASTLINSVLNGLIAFFTYRTRGIIPFDEASIDILITVGIISFLVSWIGVGSARGEIIKGNLLDSDHRFLKLPNSASVRALIIMAFCIIVFGWGIMNTSISMISPNGLSNWAYIITKTLYTGAVGALGTWLAILSALGDKNRK